MRSTVKHRAASAQLRGVEQKLHLDRFIGQDDASSFRAVDDTGVEQGGHIAVNRLHIAVDATSGFADGHRPGTTERRQQFQPLGHEHLSQKFGRGEADSRRPLRLAGRHPRAKPAIDCLGLRTASVTVFTIPPRHVALEGCKKSSGCWQRGTD